MDEATPEVRVCMISLGCPKNLVDSEVILGHVGAEGLAIAPRPEDADVIVINTCGFIESAKEESIDAILRMCEIKRRSPKPKKVVVAGCLAQRYGSELHSEVPEVDAIIGLGEYEDIGVLLRRLVASPDGQGVLKIGDPNRACQADVGRLRLTPAHFAYVRVSEGCDNPCTFCAIPAIRGAFRSKPMPAILEEVRELVASGAREIILISQDTTSYGVDLTGRHELPSLLEAIARIEDVRWIRVLYTYPLFLDDALLDAVASIDKVVKYIDLPLQHISDKMLRRMGRRSSESRTRALLARLRERIPGLYLRTTFIVGFPGEDEREFGVLRDFVRDFRFERLGVFAYSEEEGTPAARFPDKVQPRVRARRAKEIMLIQQANAFAQSRSRRGETPMVVVDSVEETGRQPVLRARSHGEAPEIDPSILVEIARPAALGAARRGGKGKFREIGTLEPGCRIPVRPGDFLAVRIVGARGYDLLAKPLAGPVEGVPKTPAL